MEELHFELLENGLDFISSGLAYVARGETKSDLKYGVLHLASGIELVLKERLRQEDWTLVFKQPEKADENNYNPEISVASINENVFSVLRKSVGSNSRKNKGTSSARLGHHEIALNTSGLWTRKPRSRV
jgi:hypothetical protein